MEMWMPDVLQIHSAAYGGYGAIKPIAVVNHIMQGYQSTMIAWAQQRPYVQQKSAHFTINRAGRIVQHVPLNQASWASGSVRNPSWALLKKDANGTPKNPNGYIVNIEHEGFSVPPGYGYDYVYSAQHPWPEAMVKATIEVQKWVCEQLSILPSTDTIIGHAAIDSVTRKNDPGPLWPQSRIIASLTQRTLPPPINKNLAYWAIARGQAVPVRYEGDDGVYELKVRAR